MNFEAFYKLSYGLYIISSSDGEKRNGYVGNTAFQVTAEPGQIAISCNKDNLTTSYILNSGLFSISVLGQEASAETIGLFGFQSGKETDKFKDTNYIIGETGTPIVLDGAIAWFECKVVATMDVGTHMLIVGEIINNDLLQPDGMPLTYDYYRNIKKGVAPKNAPTYIDKSKINSIKKKYPDLHQYSCIVCHYNYDPELGIPNDDIEPGTAFEELPDNWTCPICGATKDMFESID